MSQRKAFVGAVCAFYSVAVTANEPTVVTSRDNPTLPDTKVVAAQNSQPSAPELALSSTAKSIDLEAISGELQHNKALTEQLLHRALISGQMNAVKKLWAIYQTFSGQDSLLSRFAQAKIAKAEQRYRDAIADFRQMLAENPALNPVRIELAIVLFLDQQDREAKAQFEQALNAANLPADVRYLIGYYLNALAQRDRWDLQFSARYLHEKNVNNASNSEKIENTAFVKGRSMLPQQAHGVGYSFSLARDFNVAGSHYVHLGNELFGKNYWDNHAFDDITNRTYVGYKFKTADQRWALLPFYERQWYGNHRYKWANGVRGEQRTWLNRQWQLATALEYSQNRYHQNANLNGNSKLASLTLEWQRSPRQFFYLGTDFMRETTAQRSYSYDLKTVRLGWGQEWNDSISSRVSVAVSARKYRDNLRLGNVLRFDHAREDRIYSASLTLWKRDWQLWGITPKLNYTWKKQRSNFASLYSYRDDSVNLFIDKAF